MAKSSASVIRRLAAGVLLINLFVAALAWLWLNHSKQQDQESAAVSTRNLAQLLEQHLVGTVEKIDLALLAAAEEIKRQAANGGIDRQATNAFLARQQERLPGVFGLRATDAKGMVVYGDGVNPDARQDNSDREYFIRQRDNPKAGLVIAKPILTRIDKQWAAPFSRPVRLPDGSFGGVVYANMSLAHLSKTFSAIDIGKYGVIALREEEFGLVVRHPEPQSIDASIGNKAASGKFLAMTQSGQTSGTYTAIAAIDNIERVFSYRKPPSLPYYIIVGLATDDFLVEWRKEVVRVSALLMLFFLATLLLSWLFYRAWQRYIAAHNALAEQEDKLRIVADYNYDWEYWQGAEREILFISPSCEQITGYSQPEFVADPDLIQRIAHPDDQYLMQKHLDNFDSLQTENLDFRIVRRDGGIRWIAHGCRPVFGKNGQFLGRRISNRDITERVQKELELRKFKAVIESTDDAIITKSLDGIIESWNHGAEILFGYTAAEATGQPLQILIPPDRLSEEAGILARISQGLRVEHFEMVCRHKNGRLIDISTTVSPVLDDKGKVIGASKIARNITQQKLADEAIRQSEARFRQIFNGGNDAIYVIDPVSGKFTEANDTGCRRLGYSHAEMLCMGPADISDPSQEDAAPLMKQVMETGYGLFERNHVAKNGRKIPVEIGAHRMEFDGKAAILSVVRDISERKQAETEYRTLIQTTHDGFWVVSIPEGRFMEINPAYCSMIGYTEQELLGMRIIDIEAAEKPEETAAHMKAVMEGREERFVSRHRHKDGRLLDVEIVNIRPTHRAHPSTYQRNNK